MDVEPLDRKADIKKGKAPHTAPLRSSHWSKVRKQHLEKNSFFLTYILLLASL